MYSTNPLDFQIKKPGGWEGMTLYQKIYYYKNNLDSKFAQYVDKLNAKTIIHDLCGDSIKTAPLIRVLSGPTDFTEEDLDTANIIKSSHGSGWNIPITDTTKVEGVIANLKDWNKPYKGSATGESQYQYITPQFYIEKKIEDPLTGKTGNAQVYMFRCIHGNPVVFSIRRGNIQNNYYIDKRKIDAEKFPFEFPSQYDTMVFWAKQLSKPFEFVRIDFYISTDESIYFSEYTFTPSGGAQLYPSEVEKELGKLWV